jgi:hypothetical protein
MTQLVLHQRLKRSSAIVVVALTIVASFMVMMIAQMVPAYAQGGQFVAQYYSSSNGGPVCVDIPAANYGNGVNVESWYCNGGGNQSWIAVPDGAGHDYLESAGNTSYCLDNLANPNGNAGIWSCNRGDDQKWNVFQFGDGRSMWGATNNGTTCLSINSAADTYGYAEGWFITQESCNQSNRRQIWHG